MKDSKYITEIIELNKKFEDRYKFHEESAKVLQKMAGDKNFWFDVFKQNLTDAGFVNREWTMYDIPFFYVYECDDFYVKIHLFVPLSTYEPSIMASAIHHHNNYMLTTLAAFGSGYETMLFEKKFTIDPSTGEADLKIREHFTQKDRPVHLIDAWEPHVVINPTSLSATLIVWSPDKKRVTDTLRSNPILKALKTPLREIIYALGLDRKIGIAAKDTYQFYIKDNRFVAIKEDEFFHKTRNQKGSDVNEYSVQTLFAFMQRMGFKDVDFLNNLLNGNKVPSYYNKWIQKILNEEHIPDTFAKSTLNFPGGVNTVQDILNASRETENNRK